jgi:hypothetical protein
MSINIQQLNQINVLHSKLKRKFNYFLFKFIQAENLKKQFDFFFFHNLIYRTSSWWNLIWNPHWQLNSTRYAIRFRFFCVAGPYQS